MVKKMLLVRVAGPTMLISVLLLLVCIGTAIFLYRYQIEAADVLSENIVSRRIASEIETALRNLSSAHQESSDKIVRLQDHIRDLLQEAQDRANWEEETSLENQLEGSFNLYLENWENYQNNPQSKNLKQQTIQILEKETMQLARRLRVYNSNSVEASEAELHKILGGLVWGLLFIGISGATAGVLMGYSVTRRLQKSMHQLSVQIQDATGKLRQELPPITLSLGDGMDVLHQQVRNLAGDIEKVLQELHQRNQEVMRSEQMAAVGHLAAGVAHELRNPLTAVKMLIQASREEMEERGLPSEDLVIIEQEIRRLEKKLQTFLDFARPPKMEQREVNLRTVIEEALALIQGRARRQKVQVIYSFTPENLPICIDAEQVRQLLVNLLLNALDAMPRGGTLKLDLQKSRDSVAIGVRDSGEGISKNMLPRLFEPFASGKETGLGLGLVISRRIAEEHGGTLVAENCPEGGACFTVTLPCVEDNALVGTAERAG